MKIERRSSVAQFTIYDVCFTCWIVAEEGSLKGAESYIWRDDSGELEQWSSAGKHYAAYRGTLLKVDYGSPRGAMRALVDLQERNKV